MRGRGTFKGVLSGKKKRRIGKIQKLIISTAWRGRPLLDFKLGIQLINETKHT